MTLCRSIEGPSETAKIYKFLNDLKTSKEETAGLMAAERKVSSGLVAVIGCVEPCQIVQIRKNHETKMLELQVELAKYKHYCDYYLDPDYGPRYNRLRS